MTASAASRLVPSTTGIPPPNSIADASPDYDALAGRRLFKKHKVLPRPGNPRQHAPDVDLYSLSVKYPAGPYTSLSRDVHLTRSSARATPRRQPEIIGARPDPPSTPPANSGTSLSTQSALPSSPTYVATSTRGTVSALTSSPTTSTSQRTTPTPTLTPERTPPGSAERRPKARPPVNDRMPSKTATDSRTASFKTAPETHSSSEEDDGKSTLRALPPSARTSQTTVRPAKADARHDDPRSANPIPLRESAPEDGPAPRTRQEFTAFDGEWGSGTEVEQEWDDNLMRNVTVRKRRADRIKSLHEAVDEVAAVAAAATNAANVLRSLSLQDSPAIYPSSRRPEPDQNKTSTGPSASESSVNMEARRSSAISTKSTVSTVVEAMLVDAHPPRRRTLRHVKKQATLRDSGLDLSHPDFASSSLRSEESTERSRPVERRGRERTVSIATSNSISSRKARNEVWRNGGVPVVVVPARHSSVKSNSREPSLRSTSSRRSKRSRSVGSAPMSAPSRGRDSTPHSGNRRQPGRAPSGSDRSRSRDQRTMDYPPVVPTRSSSLSAPTSRNTSRAGSLTTESLDAHNALQAQQVHKALQKVPTESPRELRSPGRTQALHPSGKDEVPSVAVVQPDKPDKTPRGPVSHRDGGYDDPFHGARLSVQKTPFSQASVETTVTSLAEVSEALAVSIFPHQNRSLLVVNHSNKPSESSSLEQGQKRAESEESESRKTQVEATGPVTPPQPIFSMDDVDSPLRNPRAPPEPPAIKFIPATPSGLTPTVDKERQLGNYFEEASPETNGETGRKLSRSASLFRKTLSLRQHSEYGPSASKTHRILTRTFSLPKGLKREGDGGSSRGKRSHRSSSSLSAGGSLPDENRLHPFWRPSYSRHSIGGGSLRNASGEEEGWDEETLRYPPVDNRPTPRRSLSSRMKHTFAILPSRDDKYDDYYDSVEAGGTAHRTIRRTPSGNLRVVQHRPSLDSLPPQAQELSNDRPYTAPDQGMRSQHHWFQRSNSMSKFQSNQSQSDSDSVTRSKFLPNLGSKIEKYGLHNLPRMISERQREKRSRELRDKISGPREVRDGVGDVIKKNPYRDIFDRPLYA